MTPWTRSTAPFVTELAGIAGGLMSGAGAPGSSSAPAGNAASQTVANKAKGHKSNLHVNIGGTENSGDGSGAPAAPAAAADGFDPMLILAVMVFVLVLVAVVALLGR